MSWNKKESLAKKLGRIEKNLEKADNHIYDLHRVVKGGDRFGRVKVQDEIKRIQTLQYAINNKLRYIIETCGFAEEEQTPKPPFYLSDSI